MWASDGFAAKTATAILALNGSKSYKAQPRENARWEIKEIGFLGFWLSGCKTMPWPVGDHASH